MSAFKDGKKWRVQVYYTDWRGERQRKQKKGFTTRREALEWEKAFQEKMERSVDINFENFVEIYFEDMSHRLRENTILTKRFMVDMKITPFFKSKQMCDITTSDIREWQNMLIAYRNKDGKPYAQTYLKSINVQLAAIFNYATRYYDLKSNPCRRAGSIGKSNSEEMNYWTQEEFNAFLQTLKDKPKMRMAFIILYWTGMRVGEMLALTYGDIDWDKKCIRVTKSYQRLKGKDVITEPKTAKSKRSIIMPEFLLRELKTYCNRLYGILDSERMFQVTKSNIEHEMANGIKKSGVKKIRVHDLRHSHASLLINMGVEPLEIANRLGHEKIETTLNTYSHLYPDHQTKLATLLEETHVDEDLDEGVI